MKQVMNRCLSDNTEQHSKSAPMVAGRSSTYFEKSIIYWDPSTRQNEKDQL